MDYAEAVPSSNTNTDLRNVLGGGGGGGGFFFPGGGRGFPGGGAGTFQIKSIGTG